MTPLACGNTLTRRRKSDACASGNGKIRAGRGLGNPDQRPTIPTSPEGGPPWTLSTLRSPATDPRQIRHTARQRVRRFTLPEDKEST